MRFFPGKRNYLCKMKVKRIFLVSGNPIIGGVLFFWSFCRNLTGGSGYPGGAKILSE